MGELVALLPTPKLHQGQGQRESGQKICAWAKDLRVRKHKHDAFPLELKLYNDFDSGDIGQFELAQLRR